MARAAGRAAAPGALLAVAAAVATVAAASRPPAPDFPGPVPGLTLRIEVPSVQLYPVVRAGDRYVRDLGAEDFELFEDGRPIAIDSLESDLCALSVALMIDVSDSMNDKLGRVQEAACRFIDRLGIDDTVSVWGVSHLLWQVGSPTSNREAAKAAVRQLPSGGGTALYDAVDHVVQHAFSPLDRNLIILFTDGHDQTRTRPSEVARLARERGVIVYTLNVPEPDASLEGLRGIRLLAGWTGGVSRFVPGVDELDRVFDGILEDLRAQYRLSFTPSPGPPGVRKIKLRAKKHGYAVRCRERYRYGG